MPTALHADKYAINMMYAAWKNGLHETPTVFDMFFRKLPFNSKYAVFAGLSRLISYLEDLNFEDSQINWLANQPEGYDPAFIEYVRTLGWSGTLYSAVEGEIIFPGEPLVRVESTLAECLLIEAALLNFINYQSLIATKASIIRQAAGPNKILMEFGTRRAQEHDAAIWGTRAAIIGGFDATSNMEAGMLFGIPAVGTHAHAWVEMFDSELDAFRAYASVHPDQCTLLVDTYDTLGSGVPNAITIAKELESSGHKLVGIRLDSGDLAYLSRMARRMLDDAGLDYVKIVASNDIDEHVIRALNDQYAKIDTYGIGTKLITASDNPSFGGVYKLVQRNDTPVIKLSDSPGKTVNPGSKGIYRRWHPIENRYQMDIVHLMRGDEHLENQYHREVLQRIYVDGNLEYSLPTVQQIKRYHMLELQKFTFNRTGDIGYPVALSDNLGQLKEQLIKRHRGCAS